MSDAVVELRDALAKALVEQKEVEAAYEEALAAWHAEMRPLMERKAEVAARVQALDEAAREAIRDAITDSGPGAIDDVAGFAAARVRTIHYDERELIAFLKQHEPSLLRVALVPNSELKAWLVVQPEAVDFETGERCRVRVNEFSQVRIPISETWEIQPRISNVALLTLEDEKAWRESHGDKD